MRVVGAINHFLFPSMLSALFIWGIWFFVFFAKQKELDIKLWGTRYIFLTYIASVFMVTEAYKVFIEGFPTFFMEANLIPFFYTIKDILDNPFGTMEQICYNFILFIPFGFLIVISFPYCKWKLRKIIIVTFIVVLGIEILEYLSGRYMDIDDVFINVCGSVLGYIIYKVIYITYNKAYHYIKKRI
jgi:glycopeptide antibiotics resistance protein